MWDMYLFGLEDREVWCVLLLLEVAREVSWFVSCVEVLFVKDKSMKCTQNGSLVSAEPALPLLCRDGRIEAQSQPRA